MTKSTTKSTAELNMKVCGVCGEVISQTDTPDANESIIEYELCKKHADIYEDGYVALVVVTNDSTSLTHLKWEEAKRTGHVAFIPFDVFHIIFDETREDRGEPLDEDLPAMVYVDKSIYDELAELAKSSDFKEIITTPNTVLH